MRQSPSASQFFSPFSTAFLTNGQARELRYSQYLSKIKFSTINTSFSFFKATNLSFCVLGLGKIRENIRTKASSTNYGFSSGKQNIPEDGEDELEVEIFPFRDVLDRINLVNLSPNILVCILSAFLA